jgi:alkenylglycerophosphocholine hydrolase
MILLIVALILAPLEWFFEYKKNRLGIYLTKPTVMLLLIAWILTDADVPTLMLGVNTSSILWFILGLFICFWGDIFLMLPGERLFLPGLISFLLGHFFYIIGFYHVIPPAGSAIVALVIAIILVLVSGWVYVRLANGMQESGKTGMRIPVLIYTIVIAFMLYSAVLSLFDENWLSLPASFVSVGALLFMISDIMNAWVRFVGPIKNHRVWIMSTYHLAQFGIALGATLHFAMMAR